MCRWRFTFNYTPNGRMLGGNTQEAEDLSCLIYFNILLWSDYSFITNRKGVGIAILPSEMYNTFGRHFYSMFEANIIIAHETCGFSTEKIFKSGEMNTVFIPK
jgi:hypothetical protein